jgi:uncharacterized iron-regulated membrane protein
MLHKTIGGIAFIPLLLICVSGIALTFRNQIIWLSPNKPIVEKMNFPSKWISADKILEMYQPTKDKSSHGKIKSLVYNLNEGFITLRTSEDYEYNIHGESAELISEGPKRSLFFSRVHQELFLGSKGKMIAVFPTALMLLYLLCSGVYLMIRRKLNAKQF